MKKLMLLFLAVFLVGSASAAHFASIDNEGLSFVSEKDFLTVVEVLCPGIPLPSATCHDGAVDLVNQKIVGWVDHSSALSVQTINPEAGNALLVFKEFKFKIAQNDYDMVPVTKILKLNEEGTIEAGSMDFGEATSGRFFAGPYFGFKIGGAVYLENVKVDFDKLKRRVVFKENGYCAASDSEFGSAQEALIGKLMQHVYENIKSESKNTNAFIVFEMGNITMGKKVYPALNLIEADFTKDEKGDDYVIGYDKVYVPGNSRLLFNGKKIEVLVADNGELKKEPEPVYDDVEGVPVEIKGKDVILPKDNVLEQGVITYLNGVSYVKLGTTATINGVKVIPETTDVEIKFGSKGTIRFIREFFGADKDKGNYVRFADKVEMNGKGFRIEFSPRKFVSGSELGANPSARYIDLKDSENGGYYQTGDQGDDVQIIQRIVGLKGNAITGVYDTETVSAVKKWQKKNNIAVDGYFGPESLQIALGDDRTKSMGIEATGGRIVVSEKSGKLDMDFDGDAVFNVGSQKFKSESFVVNKFMEDVSLTNAKNGRYFQRGDKGKDVELIQKLVGLEGDDIDGVYGSETERAVKEWQEKNGLLVDGYFGPESLNTSLQGKEVLYKSIKDSYFSSMGVGSSIKLRDDEGEIVSSLDNNDEGMITYEGEEGGSLRLDSCMDETCHDFGLKNVDALYIVSSLNGGMPTDENKVVASKDNVVVYAIARSGSDYFTKAKNAPSKVKINNKVISLKYFEKEIADPTWYKVGARAKHKVKSRVDCPDLRKDNDIDYCWYQNVESTYFWEGTNADIIEYSQKAFQDGWSYEMESRRPAKGSWWGSEVNVGTERLRVELQFLDGIVSSLGEHDSSERSNIVKKDYVFATGSQVGVSGISNSVHRISRRADPEELCGEKFKDTDSCEFLTYVYSYESVPWIWGNSGFQADNYIGFDCADLASGAYRQMGSKLGYTNANTLATSNSYTKPRIEGVYVLTPLGAEDLEGNSVDLPIGTGPNEVHIGDIVFLDFADSNKRKFTHTLILAKDEIPKGKLTALDTFISACHYAGEGGCGASGLCTNNNLANQALESSILERVYDLVSFFGVDSGELKKRRVVIRTFFPG